MAELGCRHFNGYKPCAKAKICDRAKCDHFTGIEHRVLIVHLEALGAVLRSTSLLPAIRRTFPRAHVTWITKAPAHRLLEGITDLDRILTIGEEDILRLAALEFDVALVIDKSLLAAGVLSRTRVAEIRGFRADRTAGAVVPANPEAVPLWELGLSDHKKFFENEKSEQRLTHEALNLGPFKRDEYQVVLNESERAMARERRRAWSPNGMPVIGINTGCSPGMAAKKLTVDGHRRLIVALLGDSRFLGCPVVLLGGPEDTDRNRAIGKGLAVVQSPTERGLRDGMASVEACDLVFTGDSLGLHLALGLRKWVVAWFGPTCPQEIDLYDRGAKVMASVGCSPCWKRDCHKPTMCYDQVDFQQARNAIAQGLQWLTSSSRPLFQEISSLPSL